MPPPEPVIVSGCRSDTTEDGLRELLDAGVGEIYVGYVSPAWRARFGMEVSPNRRYKLVDQIVEPDQLRRLAGLARAHDVPVQLALNAPYYPPEAPPLLDEIVATALDAGVTGFIVADLALLDRLHRELDDDVELIASQEAGVDNAPMARLLVELGASRVIFARETTLAEMRAMSAALVGADVDLEAFVAREFCLNSSSRCFASHGHVLRTCFCMGTTRRRLIDRSGAEQDTAPWPHTWSRDPRFAERIGTLHRCGLCAIPALLAMGVRYLKVPGRSSHARDAVRLVRRVLEASDRSPEACRALVDCPDFCSGKQCYYALSPRPVAPTPAAPPPGRSPRRICARGRDERVELYLPTGTVTARLLGALADNGLRGTVDRLDDFWFADGERDASLRTLDALASAGYDTQRPPTRVQLGMELCGHRLPSAERLGAELALLQDAGVAVSIVLPVAYEALWRRLVETLDAVLPGGDERLELVVNDLGLLGHAAHHWPTRLATGRLLFRMTRDQYAEEAAALPAPEGLPDEAPPADLPDRLRALRRRQQRAYGFPYLGEPFYRRLLGQHGVGAVGLDVLPTPLSAPLPTEVDAMLYLPWTVVATTRACPVAAAVEGNTVSHPTERCQRACRRHAFLYDYAWRHPRTVQRGTGVVQDASRSVAPFLASATPRFRRVVVELGVPW